MLEIRRFSTITPFAGYPAHQTVSWKPYSLPVEITPYPSLPDEWPGPDFYPRGNGAAEHLYQQSRHRDVPAGALLGSGRRQPYWRTIWPQHDLRGQREYLPCLAHNLQLNTYEYWWTQTTSLANYLNSIPGVGGGLQKSPFRFFLSHRQTPGAIKLKLSDFVSTFIAHILANKKILRVMSGQVARTDHVTAAVQREKHVCHISQNVTYVFFPLHGRPYLMCFIVKVWSRAKAKAFFRSVSNLQSFVSARVPKICIS